MGRLLLKPRERRLALIALGVLSFWAVIALVIEPMWSNVDDLKVRVENQTEKLNALNRLLAKASLVNQAQEALSPYLSSESIEEVQRSFLDELEALSRQSNLRLNLKPRGIKKDASFKRIVVELSVEGGQGGLLDFLSAILQMQRLVRVERLRISSLAGRESMLRAHIVLSHLVVTIP